MLLGKVAQRRKLSMSSVHLDLLGTLPELLKHVGQPHSHPLGVGDPHPLDFLGDVASLDAADDAVVGVQGVPPRTVGGRGQRRRGVGIEAADVAALVLHGLLNAPVVGLPQGLDPVELGGVLVKLLTIREIN